MVAVTIVSLSRREDLGVWLYAIMPQFIELRPSRAFTSPLDQVHIGQFWPDAIGTRFLDCRHCSLALKADGWGQMDPGLRLEESSNTLNLDLDWIYE